MTTMGRGWEGVEIATSAKYLGFLVGPGRDDNVWVKAAKKWRACACSWSDTGVGLQYGAMLYNVFAASVLYFLAQMEIFPEELQKEEPANMRRLAKGGAIWSNASDLWRMGADCGIGRSFHCLVAHCEAAMLRTLYFEKLGEAHM